jgi:choline kinase
VKAIILAAGRGSRMQSLTEKRPKCLVEFRGKPLLQWQLDALRGAGLSEIAIVRGYRGDLLESYGLKMFDNPRWAETQMVSSLACAAEWLQKDICIVSYSDIFYSADTVAHLITATADLSLTYDPDWLTAWSKRFTNPLDDAETFRIDATGKILEIGNKPKTVKEVQGQYMGLLRFCPKGWTALHELRMQMNSDVRDKMDMTSALQRLIGSGFSIRGVPVCSEWGEVDSMSDLRSLEIAPPERKD